MLLKLMITENKIDNSIKEKNKQELTSFVKKKIS